MIQQSRPSTRKLKTAGTIPAAGLIILAGVYQSASHVHWAVAVSGGAILFAVSVVQLHAADLGRTRLARGVFVIHLALALAYLTLTRGSGMLATMPLLSFSALTASMRTAILSAVSLLGVLLALGATRALPASEAISKVVHFLPAATFVFAFSTVSLREGEARREAERYATELAASNARLIEYSAEIESLAAESERARIAREIHDSLGHGLVGANVQIEAARVLLDGNTDRARECLERAQVSLRRALVDVRRSVAALRSEERPRPLVERIAELCSECDGDDIELAVDVVGAARPLAPEVELAVYRTAQEALTNVRRHSCARSAKIVLDYAEDEVRLLVSDDGVGSSSRAEGFGLRGLEERAELLGGALLVSSAAGAGFELRLRLPA